MCMQNHHNLCRDMFRHNTSTYKHHIGTTNNVSSTSLANLMNASVHAHQCNCVIQKVACEAQGLFIRGKSCNTLYMQAVQAESDNILPCACRITMNQFFHSAWIIQKVACVDAGPLWQTSPGASNLLLAAVHLPKFMQCGKKSPKPITIWKKHMKNYMSKNIRKCYSNIITNR